MATNPDRLEELFEVLRGSGQAARPEAVRELREAGERRRGDRRTRGSAIHVAPQPIPARDIESLLAAVDDQRWEVRRDAVLAVGEFSDDDAIETLGRLARTDPEWRVREAVAEALACIGGPGAVELMEFMARTDPHPRPAGRACRGMADLAVAAFPEDVGPRSAPARGAVRTRGAIRVRGASPSRRLPPAADKILRVLDEIRTSHRDAAVRAAAEESLAELDR